MGTNPTSSANPSLGKSAEQAATAGQAASTTTESTQDSRTWIGLGSGTLTGSASIADWKASMTPMSFKGVPFPVTQVKVSSGRKLVKHVYPYRGSQDIVDLGRQPLSISVSAVFANDPRIAAGLRRPNIYPGLYEELLTKINEGTTGLLEHPVFGAIQAACESFDDTTQATEINTVRLELTFAEDGLNSSRPFVGTASLAAAQRGAAALDAFAAGAGVDPAGAVGTTFAGVVDRVTRSFSAPGKSRDEVAAVVEAAAMDLDILAGAVPAIDDPINVAAKAELASLLASINMAASEYLAGFAPIVSIVTTTQTTTSDIAKERYLDPGRAREIELLNDVPDPLVIAPGTELKVHAY